MNHQVSLSKFTTLKLSLVVDCVETKPVVEFESVIFLNLFIVPTEALCSTVHKTIS